MFGFIRLGRMPKRERAPRRRRAGGLAYASAASTLGEVSLASRARGSNPHPLDGQVWRQSIRPRRLLRKLMGYTAKVLNLVCEAQLLDGLTAEPLSISRYTKTLSGTASAIDPDYHQEEAVVVRKIAVVNSQEEIFAPVQRRCECDTSAHEKTLVNGAAVGSKTTDQAALRRSGTGKSPPPSEAGARMAGPEAGEVQYRLPGWQDPRSKGPVSSRIVPAEPRRCQSRPK